MSPHTVTRPHGIKSLQLRGSACQSRTNPVWNPNPSSTSALPDGGTLAPVAQLVVEQRGRLHVDLHPCCTHIWKFKFRIQDLCSDSPLIVHHMRCICIMKITSHLVHKYEIRGYALIFTWRRISPTNNMGVCIRSMLSVDRKDGCETNMGSSKNARFNSFAQMQIT